MKKPAKAQPPSRTADPPFAAPDHAIETVQLAKLKPHPNNPRTHPAAQVDGLGKSMQEFGVTSVIVVDDKGMILAGHGRVQSATKNGIEELPAMVVRGWSEKRKLAFMLADNQWALTAGWDDALLRESIEMLKLGDGFNLEALGWSAEQLDELLAFGNPGMVDPEIAPDPVKEPIVRSGDLWLLGNHRILCGSSTVKADVDRLLNGAVPNLMVTDPPYGVEYDPNWRNEAGRTLDGGFQRLKSGKATKPISVRATGKVKNDDRADWREAWALFSGNTAYIWHADRHASEVEDSIRSVGFEIRCQIIWSKSRFVIGRGDYHWQHEPCWYAVRKGNKANWQGSRSEVTVWEITHQVSETGHGTQKPIECMKRPIENNSRKGEHIYEPFSGSGTTIIACEMTGRKCLAIEIDPAYTQVAIERWQTFAGKKATLNGRSFDEVAKERTDEARHPRKPVRRPGRSPIPVPAAVAKQAVRAPLRQAQP